jgi:4-amino-4-deoxy-L-arabinose transferase
MPASARTFCSLLALLALLAFAFQGSRGIWEPDEGRYTSVGINMLRGGDWLVPTIDMEHPHLTKPPVTYWALAASFGLLGANEWAARLPAALAFVGTGLLLFGLGRRLLPAKPWLPTVVWSLSLAPFFGANIVSTDALLVFFETAAMAAFVEAWVRPSGSRRTWIRLMWLGWGLAFMTKGPPGLLPLLAMVVCFALHDRRRLRDLLDPVGLVLFVVVAATWFVLVIRQDPTRLPYFLGYEVYDRVFTATHRRNAQWYGGLMIYLPTLLVGALPWSVPAIMSAGGTRAAWRRIRAKVRERDREWLLLLYWFLLPLAVFMLARSRLPLYVLPLFVPLALMISRPLSRWRRLEGNRLKTVALVTAIALLASKGAVAHLHSDRDSRPMAVAVHQLIDSQDFDGITFLGMPPFHGLNVYLGRPVKSVPFVAGADTLADVEKAEDLCSELVRDRRTLFAMKLNKA